ncbi:hypothetical protein M8818_003622 [Zalaria obscura]|uniref:Uncharacterized protein n=1 Tax=Zalaria obscura TaxID=2024903 RepID=A0ACC3SI94_9PEZI
MSKALNSPTARLLRSSRLFSIPPPLPQPSIEALLPNGQVRSSDTATLPYPIHQAIATPPSSQHRGDWGLKRPLPERSTKASGQTLRIKAIDNMEHITDFESAADHTMTLAKWQEMGVPVTIRTARDSITRKPTTPVSVYENELDNTSLFSVQMIERQRSMIERLKAKLGRPSQETAPLSGSGWAQFERMLESMEDTQELEERLSGLTAQLQNMQKASSELSKDAATLRRRVLDNSGMRKRWKTRGPWVAGQSEDEFQRYLKLIKKKYTKEFIEFVAAERFEQSKRTIMQKRRDEGLDVDDAAGVAQEEIAQQAKFDLETTMKELRDENRDLSSELSTLVRDFFDLPAFPTQEHLGSESQRSVTSVLAGTLDADADDGPPSTHPAAGLDYTRTGAYMENNPLYGPQANHSPVEARVLRAKNSVIGSIESARLGVGGFVTTDPHLSSYRPNNRDQDKRAAERMVYALDPELEGGNKLWVHPTRAYVDEMGRVQLNVIRGDAEAIGVKTGDIVEKPEGPSIPQSPVGNIMQPLDRPPPGTRGNANFGTGLRPGPRIRGYDEELRKRRETASQAVKEGTQDGPTQIDEIKRLMEEHRGESTKKPF